MGHVSSCRARASASAVAAALIALGAAPGTSHGALTISYSSSTGLLIAGDAASDGASVQLRETSGPRRFSVRGIQAPNQDGQIIPAATLVPGAGCQVVTETGLTLVECNAPGSLVLTGNLGDGPDLLSGTTPGIPGDMFVDGGGGSDILSGGSGFDALEGAAGNDQLAGAAGNDAVEGGDGNDRFIGDFAGTDTLLGEAGNDTLVARPIDFSADLFNGGGGVDTADYSLRTGQVRVSTVIGVPSSPNDGAFLEGDDLDAVETLIGGSGNDFLQHRVESDGRTVPLVLGTRTLTGNRGNDDLRIVGGITSSLDGGLGTDKVSGGSRVDTIFSRDAEADQVTCGAAVDSQKADLRDDPFSATCESVDQGAVEEGPNVIVRSRSLRVRPNGSIAVRLRCPRRLPHRCAGRLAARLDARRTPFGRGTRYSLRPGRSGTVATRLRAGQRRRARRRGARVRLRSVERGRHGPKTTLRLVRVRRR